MLTSASQRFEWKTTAVRLTNSGLSYIEETPRHVTCVEGELKQANVVLRRAKCAFLTDAYVMFKV